MNVDTNIENYKINELIQLLDLEEVQDDDNFLTLVNEKTDKLINDCIIQGNSNLANFFLNVKQVFNNDNSEESKNIAKDETVVFNPANIVQRKTITKLLNIDSRFRNNYTTTKSTQFTIDLPQKVYNATELTLSDLEIPTTFYGFAAEYNPNFLKALQHKSTSSNSKGANSSSKKFNCFNFDISIIKGPLLTTSLSSDKFKYL